MAIDAKQDIQDVRIPFIGNFLTRITQDPPVYNETADYRTDQYFLNGLFWAIENPITGKKTTYLTKRPGISVFLTSITNFLPSGYKGALTIRRSDSTIFAAGATGLYRSGSSPMTKIADINSSTTTFPQFAETRPSATTPYTCLNTGVELAIIDASNNVTILKDIDIVSVSAANPAVVTTATAHGLTTGTYTMLKGVAGSTPDVNDTRYQVTVTGPTTFTIPVNVSIAGTGGNLGNFPANTGSLIYMNGYLYIITPDGRIYNCDFDDPFNWDPTRFITAQMYAGTWYALARQNNFLLAFSSNAIQTFTDEANETGSPLQNYESGVQQIGSISGSSLVTDGSDILWVGTTSTGQQTVYRMNGLTSPREVAPTPVKNLLNNYNFSVQSAFFFRVSGKNLYIIFGSLAAGAPTIIPLLVYDIDLDLWCGWNTNTGTFEFTAAAFISNDDTGYFLTRRGEICKVLTSLPQDYTTPYTNPVPIAVPFTFEVQTERIDFGTMRRKFVQRLELVCDISPATANVQVSYCDDDNITFSTARNLDTSQVRPYLSLGGNFRRRRYKFSYTGDQPQRWEAFELFFRLGH